MKQKDVNLYETWLIGSILAGAPFHEILIQIDASDFTDEQYQKIYLDLCNLYSQSIPINIANCIANNIDMAPLMEIKAEIANMSDWAMYIAKIKESSGRKKLKKQLQDALEQVDTENPIAVKEKLILDFKSIEQNVSIPNFADDIKSWLDDIRNNKNFRAIIYSGLPILDRHIAPLVGARLIFIAARPSQGKTALAVQIALQTTSVGNGVAFFSLENSKPQLHEILVASAFNINRSLLALNDLSELNDYTKTETFDRFRESKLYVYDNKFKLDEICALITYLVKADKIKMAVIDYIGLIENKRKHKDSTNDYLGEISRRFKVLTMMLKIPIIVLCQLNRDSEKFNREPMLADLRSCGNFEQDADFVLMLHRSKGVHFNDKDHKLIPHLFETKLLIEKSRVGPVAFAGKYIFNGQRQNFADEKEYFTTAFKVDKNDPNLPF